MKCLSSSRFLKNCVKGIDSSLQNMFHLFPLTEVNTNDGGCKHNTPRVKYHTGTVLNWTIYLVFVTFAFSLTSVRKEFKRLRSTLSTFKLFLKIVQNF